MNENLPQRIPGRISFPPAPLWKSPADIATLVRIAGAIDRWNPPDRKKPQ